jgi:hypothetical protein
MVPLHPLENTMSAIEVPKKRGMSCLAIGGIGCLILLLALFVGGGALIAKFAPGLKQKFDEYQKGAMSNPDKALAKLGIEMIPNVVIVREDDAAKTITFKKGPSGEEMTMHYQGLGEGKGRPRVTNSKGEEVDLSKKPKTDASVVPSVNSPLPAPSN